MQSLLDFTKKYIENLCRLGLLHIPSGRYLVGKNAYEVLIKTEEFEKFKAKYESEHSTTIEIKQYIELTELVLQFKEACVIDKVK